MRGRVLQVFNQMSRPIPGRISQMVIMGLDVSLTNTGVAILYNGRVRTFSIGKGTEVSSLERLAYYRKEVLELLERYQPDVVMIEGYSFASKFSRPHSIGELGGVLRLALFDWANQRALSPYAFLVPPTTLKKAIRGIGKGTKKDVKADMLELTGLTFPDDDQCDATGLALCGLTVSDADGGASILKDAGALLPNKKGVSPVEKLF